MISGKDRYTSTRFYKVLAPLLESYMLGNLTSGPFSVPKSSSSDAEFFAEHAHINISIFSKIRVTGLCQITLERSYTLSIVPTVQ